MQTNCKKTNDRIMRRRNTGENKLERAPMKTGYTVYNSIGDFLITYPIFSLNEYGERVISGRRIC